MKFPTAGATQEIDSSGPGFASIGRLLPSYISRWQVIWVSLCLVLTVAILREVFAPLTEIQLPPVVPRPVPPNRPLPVWTAPSSETFAGINERFIFDSKRGPVTPETAAKVGTGAATPPPSALVGVIIAGGTRIAILRSPAAASSTSVEVGGMVDGWQVTEIDPDRIVIRSGTAGQTILLSANRGTPLTAPGVSPGAGSGANGPIGAGTIPIQPGSPMTQPPPPTSTQ